MNTRVVAEACIVAWLCLCTSSDVLAQCNTGRVPLDLLWRQDDVALFFVGTVKNVEQVGAMETLTFAVERLWKGPQSEVRTIYRLNPRVASDAPSAMYFERGRRYIVVAHRLAATERQDLGLESDGESFGTDTCGDGSRLLSMVEPELGRIGPGTTPESRPVRAGRVAMPIKTKDVAPLYPKEALAAGIRGTVIIEAILDDTGRVTRTRVLRSIPLLDQAAIDCVKQWEFLPSVLNGVRVPTVWTAAVTFPP